MIRVAPNPLSDLADLAQALADPSRLRALAALKDGEMCVCQLVDMLGLSASTVSKHMSLLRHAGLVAARRAGRWTYYRLPGPRETTTAGREALRWVARALADDPMVGRDRKRTSALRGRTEPPPCNGRGS